MEDTAAERRATIPVTARRSINSRFIQLETRREQVLAAGIDVGTLGATALGAGVSVALLVGTPLAIGVGGLSREFGPASLVAGAAYCLLPLTAASTETYRWLSSRVF